ncbi:DUF1697 domain-containing protein [Candidatus Shapirobacteria bacterium]|nr:DUF1697 domain-containing protein [Candidatus Shapirobacteria bacterium]
MTKYVALLRGINVGGKSKVKMATLKECFESLGYKNVATYINSGNVIFEAERIDEEEMIKEMETKMRDVFGFGIRIVVRSFENIKNICEKVPTGWMNNVEQKTDVIFLWQGVDTQEDIESIKIKPEVDTLLYIERAVVWHIDRVNYSKSGMNKFIGTNIYKNMTARNINTVRKLRQLMEGKNGDR